MFRIVFIGRLEPVHPGTAVMIGDGNTIYARVHETLEPLISRQTVSRCLAADTNRCLAMPAYECENQTSTTVLPDTASRNRKSSLCVYSPSRIETVSLFTRCDRILQHVLTLSYLDPDRRNGP